MYNFRVKPKKKTFKSYLFISNDIPIFNKLKLILSFTIIPVGENNSTYKQQQKFLPHHNKPRYNERFCRCNYW